MRAACLALLLLAACEEEEPPLPEMVPVQDFTLTNQDGGAFDSRELRGKIWIADLIFTSCPSICPMMSTTMGNLTRRIAHDDVRFVSISVDPAVDTPEVLRDYAGRYDADLSRWVFLTGSVEDVNRVVVRSFRLPLDGRMPSADGTYDILHTGRFLLIDRRGTMRGLYDTDRAGIESLEHDVERLRGEPE